MDLTAYLARTEYTGPLEPTLDVLSASRWTFWAYWPRGAVRTVLVEYRVDGTMAEHPVDPGDFAAVLADRFGLHVPLGSHLPDEPPDPMTMAHRALDGYRS